MTVSDLTVRLSAASKNLLSLLASSENETIEEYAQAVLKSHVDEAANDDAIMASLGRALLTGRSPTPTDSFEKEEEEAPKPKSSTSPNKPDGLPRGLVRTKDGQIMTHRELRSMTFCAAEVGKLMGTSQRIIIRAVEERAVVPYGYVGESKRLPRFREEEVEQVDAWLKTPCSKGTAPRNAKCPKCGRYFSGQGIRVHTENCKRDGGKLSLMQR